MQIKRKVKVIMNFLNLINVSILEGLLLSFVFFIWGIKFRVSKFKHEFLKLNKQLADKKIDTLEEDLEIQVKRNNSLALELQKTKELVVKLDTEKSGLELHIKSYKAECEKMEEKSRLSFENLANRILEEKVDKLNEISRVNLTTALTPLKENIHVFQKKLEESFINHAKEQFSLKNEIKRMVNVNNEMTLQTEGLINALKGDIKVQGNWGEVILERILEDSGLCKGRDYVLQGAGLELQNIEGNRQKPDVIIKLPEKKHVIIDSKVSLIHYEKYCREQDETLKLIQLKQFIASVKSHVDSLESKKYQNLEQLGSPDFVLMFMPIESAYLLTSQTDLTLQNYAWNKKIVIVCPSTLFATLRTIESLWRMERQNRNTIEIARQGGVLYDKMASFLADMQKLGRQALILNNIYTDAMKKLSEGSGNIINRTERLRNLGVKATKQIPLEFTDKCEELES